MRFTINGRTHHRLFSLSSAPHDDLLRITVRLNGLVSRHLFDRARPGDVVESLLPMGHFGLTPGQPAPEHVLFVAGGSGITPIFSMIRSLLHAGSQTSITLLYANRSPESTIFGAELDQLAAEHAPRFAFVPFFDSQGHRIEGVDIEHHLLTRPDTECFVCGLKELVASHVDAAGLPDELVHREGFADGYVPRFGVLA